MRRFLAGVGIILMIIVAFLIVGTIDYNALGLSCSGC